MVITLIPTHYLATEQQKYCFSIMVGLNFKTSCMISCLVIMPIHNLWISYLSAAYLGRQYFLEISEINLSKVCYLFLGGDVRDWILELLSATFVLYCCTTAPSLWCKVSCPSLTHNRTRCVTHVGALPKKISSSAFPDVLESTELVLCSMFRDNIYDYFIAKFFSIYTLMN